MDVEALTRRRLLKTAALAASGLAMPQLRRAGAAEPLAPQGRMVLGWHTNIAPRWLDPMQHDGGATGSAAPARPSCGIASPPAARAAVCSTRRRVSASASIVTSCSAGPC